MGILLRRDGKAGCDAAIRVFYFTPSLSKGCVKLIAQNREKPSLDVCSGLKLIDVSQATNHRFLNQIVGLIGIAGERHCKSPHRRNGLEKAIAKVWWQSHGFPLE